MKWISFSLPIEWIDRLFRRVDAGEIRVKVGEVVWVKGCWFEVLLISKDGLMLKPCKGTRITQI